MTNKFFFQVAVPVNYWNTCNKHNNVLEKMLISLNLNFNTEELQLPEVEINHIKFDVADNTILPKMVQSYFNIENFIYDIHGFKILNDYFNCSEEFTYDCIVFQCSFSVSSQFLEEYDNQTSKNEDNILWTILNVAFNEKEGQVRFGVTETFSEIIHANVSSLLALMNIAKPGCISSKLLFVDRYFFSEDLSSTLPDVRIFNMADTARLMRNTCDEKTYVRWERLPEINFENL